MRHTKHRQNKKRQNIRHKTFLTTILLPPILKLSMSRHTLNIFPDFLMPNRVMLSKDTLEVSREQYFPLKIRASNFIGVYDHAAHMSSWLTS